MSNEPVIQPGKYYEGNALYEVSICEDCGEPKRKWINSYIFGFSEKGLAKKRAWQAQHTPLPDGITFCDHSEEEE